MNRGDVMEDPAVILDEELTLFEYGACSDRDQSILLYNERQSLHAYVQKGWLALGFDDGNPCIRAADQVGVLPFHVDGKSHLLLIAPKGCQTEWNSGLLRFLELLFFDDRENSLDVECGWAGKRGSDQFLLFLAYHYASLLKELCQRDFRSYYRTEEDDLRGHKRGRLHHAGYARRVVHGKPHILPCRWDEFTVDNWDNRILWAAARRLKDVAASVDSYAAQEVWKPFRPLLSWFSPVAEVSVTALDFHRSHLGRMSAYYRRALTWARLLIQGSNLPGAGGQAPPLVLDAPVAFEKFVEVIIRSALPNGWNAAFQAERQFIIRQTHRLNQTRKPDILLSGPETRIAVGDTKYKDVLERLTTEQREPRNISEVLEVGLKSADWNQLYVYMRLTGASFGFFVVPFWNPNAEPFEWIDDFQFAVRPCDDAVQVAVLGINLLRPLRDVKQKASSKLRGWLLGMPKGLDSETRGCNLGE